MILPTAYMRAVADAVHSVGGIFVLDCIASGTIWVDMVEAAWTCYQRTAKRLERFTLLRIDSDERTRTHAH